jgi:hypothetical protein
VELVPVRTSLPVGRSADLHARALHDKALPVAKFLEHFSRPANNCSIFTHLFAATSRFSLSSSFIIDTLQETNLRHTKTVPSTKKNTSINHYTMSEPQTIVDPEQPDQIVLDTPAAVEDTGEESAYDRDFFHQVVRDAGRWAFGVVAVEVWVLNAAKTHLFRPDHGWWIDPYAIDCGENHTFDRLTDSSREDYLEATPLAPGCGLPGALYAQIQRGNLAAAASQNNILHHSVTWREVKPIAEDPDQPYNPRMQFLAAAGLGWAAGIPFAIGSLEGLVVYMARTTANIQKLLEPMNTDYLTHATLLIGSAYALRVPRLKVEKARREYTHNTMQRVKRKLRVLRILNKPLDRFVHEESERLSSRPTPALMYEQLGETARTSIASHPQTRCTAIWKRVAQKAVTTWKKCRGSNAQPPPPFNWRQTAWSFVGTFVTLMFLTLINKTMTEKFGSEYGIVLG